MFEPVRGGTRGGQAEFKWSDVSQDKDRENYLGHSINAPTGRWQKNKDVHWYNRDTNMADEERREEIRKVKQLEADALAVALGFEPSSKNAQNSDNAEAADSAKNDGDPQSTLSKASKEERKRQKALRKEEKHRRKEMKRVQRSGDTEHEKDPREERRTHRHRSRSRSPSRPRETRDYHLRRRSRSRTRYRDLHPQRQPWNDSPSRT